MEFELKLEIEDWIKFHNHVQKMCFEQLRDITYGYKLNIALWLIIFIIFFIIFRFLENPHWPTATLVSGLSICLFIFYFIQIKRTQLALTPSKGDYILRTSQYIIDEEGVSIKNEVSSLFYSWKAFIAVEKTDSQILLLLGSTQAIVLPINKVNDENKLYEYIDEQYKSSASILHHTTTETLT